jgi:hypothetical protein
LHQTSMPKKKSGVNLLSLTPRRAVEWENAEGGLVVLKVPRFHSRFAARWVLPRLRTPAVCVTLDALGSFVWGQCDGETTVGSIAERMQQKFAGFSDPGYDRLARFFFKLEKDKCVSMSEQ